MEHSDIILASGSPRRKELLARTGCDFKVIVSEADETAADTLEPTQVAIENATLKARAVADMQTKDPIVIGADTIVVLGGRIFGKPVDAADARSMLEELSGNTHQVITGVCIIRGDTTRTFAEVTDVTFKQLDRATIDAYLATGEPFDKAGSYGIQGKGGALVDRIDGDYDNVVGLPVQRLMNALKEFAD